VHRAFAVAGAAGLAVGTWWTLIPAANAAFPGANGDIAFVSTRDNNVAIDQVDPNGAGVGTESGDQSNTTPLTNGAPDAEPFYSPDGTTVYFSSSRSGSHWAIYSILQSTPEPPATPVELSQVPGSETDDDYSPSVAPDGQTVVFNRDSTALYTLYTSSGPSSTCLLYTPPDGLAAASSDNGAGSRAVFDPEDQSKLLYVSGNNHIHLLSGIPTPSGSNPCGVSPTALTDIDLSATASATSGGGIGGAADANPDWNPAGTGPTAVQVGNHSINVIFDSTRSGGHTLWTMDLTTTTPSVRPLWPSMCSHGMTTDTQPVFSPDGMFVTYTQPVIHNATQVSDYELDQLGSAHDDETDLTLTTGSPANSQPDWQPTIAAQTPEAPAVVMLPAGGLLILGTALGLRRRRRASAA
jgi:Tol biopolymer transport system component